MLEHVVKANESVDSILSGYHITLDELKRYNSHITDFSHLIGGVKLMIPIISQEVNQILDRTEGFVMDYYPKISEEIIPLLNNKKIDVFEKKEPVFEEKKANKIEENLRVEKSRMAYPGIMPPKAPYKGRI